jgi:arylsulfatase A-like enzyme
LAARSGSALAPFVQRVHVWLATRSTRAVVEAPVERPERAATEPRLLPEGAVVVLVTIDALRGDVFDDPAAMAQLPTLRALSEEARFFRRARTTAPATTVALTSMSRSRYFSQLRWEVADDGWTYAHRDPSPALPEVLGEGVRTLAVHGSPWLAPRHRVFGRVDEDVVVPAEGEEVAQQYVFAERLVERALDALSDEGAQLVFMHWLEAHAPYDLAGEVASDEEGYLAELAIADRALGRVRDALHARWPRRGALVVASDHGEAFGEHATRYHGATLYEEMVHVPLFVELPGVEPAVVDVPVSLVDVAPTIVDLFHRPIPGSFMGESLAPLLRGEPGPVAWAERPIFLDGGRLVRALVGADDFKLIHDRRLGTTELYDLSRDPGERNNLADALPVESAARLELLRSFFDRHEHRAPGYTTPYRPP